MVDIVLVFRKVSTNLDPAHSARIGS